MKTAVAALAALALLLGAPGAIAQKRAFTIADLYRLKAVEDPQISPDGTTIAYVVRTSDLAKAKRTACIWLIGANGENARPLTSGLSTDDTPRWSPDGRLIAFLSQRSGSTQLWLISPSGGEARQLTELSTGVAQPLWSPDGRSIAFTTEVYPECAADDGANRKRDSLRAKGPLKVHLTDRLLYRHWTAWKDGKRTHILTIDVTTKEVRDLTPGDRDAPPFQLGGPLHFAFSPDSKELCFAANPDRDEALSTNADIWLVPLSGGEPRNVTAANKAFDGNPKYSADGRFIAYRTQRRPGYEADRFCLALYNREEGTSRVVTDAFDASIDDFVWLADSRHVVFIAQSQGRTPVFRLDTQESEIQQVANAGTIDAFTVAPDGRWLAAARRTIAEPTEIVRASLETGELRRLTFVNRAIEEEVDIRPAEVHRIPGADGVPVQTYLIQPHGFDPSSKYPLILNVHGGPQSSWLDAFRGDWQVYPGAGYVVAFPNPHGSTGFGQTYVDSIAKNYTGKVMEDIAKVTSYLASLPYVDAERMGAMGWSWGGYAMMWLEGADQPFKCLAAMMGLYDLPSFFGATEELWFPIWDLAGEPWTSPLYDTHSPSRNAARFKTPCLVITGERDYRVPYTQSLQFFTALQLRRVPSRLLVFERAGHWPAWYEMAIYYNAHLEWFHRYLGGAPAPWDTEKMARNAEVFEVDES
ncbi:MAG: S9 family peptidase [Planctomycetota bacterium]